MMDRVYTRLPARMDPTLLHGKMPSYSRIPLERATQGAMLTCRSGFCLVRLGLGASILRLVLDPIHLLLLGQELLQPHLCGSSQ